MLSRVSFFLLLTIAVTADPQNFDDSPSAFGNSVDQQPFSNDSEQDELEEWSRRIEFLVWLTDDTLKRMGQIALADNPVAGQQIVDILDVEIGRATQIFLEFRTNVVNGGGRAFRSKRQAAAAAGMAAHEMVGGVLAGANKKTEGPKGDLSAGAQMGMDKAWKDGVDMCKANACKNASAIVGAAEASAGERKKG